MNTIKEVLENGETAYLTPDVSIVFNVEPSYTSIAIARRLLDSVTDSLLMRDMDLKQ